MASVRCGAAFQKNGNHGDDHRIGNDLYVSQASSPKPGARLLPVRGVSKAAPDRGVMTGPESTTKGEVDMAKVRKRGNAWRTVKLIEKVRKLLRRNSNTRDKIISLD